MHSSATEPRVLVIGYGNPLRGDDGVGWYAAQRIESKLAGRAVEVITCHQLTPELSEPISRAKLAIFIDASADEPPAHVSRREVKAADDLVIRDTHELGPAALLSAARALFGQCPPGVLYTIGGDFFGLAEELTPHVQAAADEVVERVCRMAENSGGGADKIGSGEP